VDYATVTQTAIAGSDFFATSGTIKFTAGTTNLTISVPVIGNIMPGTNKTFLVRLSNPVDATLGVREAVGTIVDDDTLRIVVLGFVGEDFRVGFTTKPSRSYRVEQTEDMAAGVWTPAPGAERVLATEGTTNVLVPAARSERQRFYRIQELP